MLKQLLIGLLATSMGMPGSASAQMPAQEPSNVEAAPVQITHVSVELLVFARTESAVASTALDVAPGYGGRSLFAATSSEISGDIERYTELPSSTHRLASAAKRLSATPGYQLLRHLRWEQSLSSQVIRIGDDDLAALVSGTAEVAAQDQDAAGLSLDVTFKSAEGQYFRLRQRQQIRLDAPSYFDHSHFGVIALVSPGYDAPPKTTPVPSP